MRAPAEVTVGVVLYALHPLTTADLARESAVAAERASRLGTPKARAFGHAIARVIPRSTWDVVLARASLAPQTDLLASRHFFAGRPAPAVVAGALAVFAHAWLHRREHGAEPPGSLPLTDLPPGPFAGLARLRDAAERVNALMLDDSEYGAWMRAYDAAWADDGADDAGRAN